MTPLVTPASSGFTLRAGAVGHRPNRLPKSAIEGIAVVVEAILLDLSAIAYRLNAQAFRIGLSRDATRVNLDVVSALAEGADQIISSLAMKHGYNLSAILPFDAQTYASSFDTSDASTLQQYLDFAQTILVADGKSADERDRNRAYMRAGELVVLHSDVIIAIWDGQPARGEGGTANVVAAGLRHGRIIIRIDPANPSGPEILLPTANNDSQTSKSSEYSISVLEQSLLKRVLPDASANARRDIAAFFRYTDTSGLQEPSGALLGLPVVSRRFVPAIYDTALEQADKLASRYARRTRQVYFAIYSVGAVAIACAAASITFSNIVVWDAQPINGKALFTVLELLLLICGSCLVAVARLNRWASRWLQYRLLAELLRPMPYLAQLGETVTLERQQRYLVSKVNRIDYAWVFSLFDALQRHVGLPNLVIEPRLLDKIREGFADKLLTEQARYHQASAHRNERLDHQLSAASELLFVVTVVAVAGKLVALNCDWPTAWLSWLAVSLPGITAACYALRSQLELGAVALRSRSMADRIRRLLGEVCDIDVSIASSPTLVAAIRQTADAMVRDTTGWAGLFAEKRLEPG